MNISKITFPNFLLARGSDNSQNYSNKTNFGLRMSRPLTRDEVSFKAKDITKKGNLKDKITFKLAKQLIEPYIKPHRQMEKFILKKFKKILSTDSKKNYVTLGGRIKEPFSIQQKSTSLSMKDYDNLISEMHDISGFEFILEEGKSFMQFCNILTKLIKDKEINVIDIEYYRLPPIQRRGKIVESYNSLNTNLVDKIARTIDEVKHNVDSTPYEKPSRSGYSGLHLTIQNSDGTFCEWQIMTRAMHDLKQVENFFYKVKNAKKLNQRYKSIEKYLKALVPPDENASAKELAEHKRLIAKIDHYTLDAYKDVLPRLFSDTKQFLKLADEEIAMYDFNKILKMKNKCDKK